jgi:fimbrial isopeptide formation D2 family protein
MKKMSKYFSLAVAAVMTICICSFGMIFEASADSYTITLTKPTGNAAYTFTDHSYKAYKVFDAEVNSSHDAYNYKITADCLGHGLTSYTNGTVTYNQQYITDETKAREFAEYLKATYFASGTPLTDTAVKELSSAIDESGNLVFTTDDEGYYVIIDFTDTTNSVASLVILQNGLAHTSSATNVDIMVKADAAAAIDAKEVKEDSNNTWGTAADFETGQTVPFRLTVKIPNIDIDYYDNAYVYKIEDTLEAGLKYVDNTFKLYSDANCTTEISVTGAAVAYDTTANVVTYTIADLRGMVGTSLTFTKGQTIYARYDTKLDGSSAALKYVKAATETTNHNKNAAKLIYSNNPSAATLYTSAEASAYAWTYAFVFEKVKATSMTTALENAMFEVYSGSVADANKMNFKKKSDGVYYVVQDAIGAEGTTTKVVTASNGKVLVYGFDNNTSYYLKETDAPQGYSVSEFPAEFKVQATYKNGGSELDSYAAYVTGKNIADSEGNIDADNGKTVNNPAARFWNASGTELIGTGGIGTTIFYVAGGILMAGAAILLITKLRMRNKD